VKEKIDEIMDMIREYATEQFPDVTMTQIRAAIEALTAWQPIETAPRDGTWIMLAGDSGYTTTPLRVEVSMMQNIDRYSLGLPIVMIAFVMVVPPRFIGTHY